MNIRQLSLIAPFALLGLAGCSSLSPNGGTTTTTTTTTIANLQPFTDTTGSVATYTTAGDINESGEFFQPLGTNGRTCASCHEAAQGMSITPSALQTLFTSTRGTDPVFAAFDGANCPTATTGNAAEHSLLLNNGLLRIGIAVPTTAQFTITAVNDPYGCAVTTNTAGQQVVSVYRRPLPTTGLPYLSDIMWDTRFTASSLSSATTLPTNLFTDLSDQLVNAVSTHEQGATTPSTSDINLIVAFEEGLFTAQTTDTVAGSLSANGATGGPTNFAAETFYPGINDTFGGDPTGAKFNPNSMTLYTAWQNSTNAQQASIARGEALFNTAPMTLSDVSGLPAAGGAVTKASCSFCHDTPNIGNHSLSLPMDTGVMHVAANETDANIAAALTQLTTPSLPTYQITGCKVNGVAVTHTTTDPGKALSTGLCADVNHMKVPILRGLAARAPYFHNGSAASLAELVDFYNARFQMGLSAAQKTDLVNFLNAL